MPKGPIITVSSPEGSREIRDGAGAAVSYATTVGSRLARGRVEATVYVRQGETLLARVDASEDGTVAVRRMAP